MNEQFYCKICLEVLRSRLDSIRFDEKWIVISAKQKQEPKININEKLLALLARLGITQKFFCKKQYPDRRFRPPDPAGPCRKDAGNSPDPAGIHRTSLEYGSSILGRKLSRFFPMDSCQLLYFPAGTGRK